MYDYIIPMNHQDIAILAGGLPYAAILHPLFYITLAVGAVFLVLYDFFGKTRHALWFTLSLFLNCGLQVVLLSGGETLYSTVFLCTLMALLTANRLYVERNMSEKRRTASKTTGHPMEAYILKEIDTDDKFKALRQMELIALCGTLGEEKPDFCLAKDDDRTLVFLVFDHENRTLKPIKEIPFRPLDGKELKELFIDCVVGFLKDNPEFLPH